MFKIKTMNKISPKGLAELPTDSYIVGDDVMNEDGILVRSAKLHEYPSRRTCGLLPGQGQALITFQWTAAPRRGSWCSTRLEPTPMPSRSWFSAPCWWPPGM